MLLPRHVDLLAKSIKNNPNGDSWNATGPIEAEEELDRHSFVKCVISKTGRIMHCFRRSPSYSKFDQQKNYTRKILGIIAYRKDFLIKLTAMDGSEIENAEFIEQMKILEHDFSLQSVSVSPSLPSVNEPHEADIALEYLKNDSEQIELLKEVLHAPLLDKR